MNGVLKIFSGNSNLPLANSICGKLGVPFGNALVTTFGDGEIRVELKDHVRGNDVFVVQPLAPNTNEAIMELLIMMDAIKRASARRITAVIPYYAYARQDRKTKPREPITAKLLADLIATSGASRVLSMEFHAGQIQGFFNIPVDNLFPSPIFIPHIQSNSDLENLVIVSPDAGGVERARAYAKRLNAGLAIIDKRRDAPGVVGSMSLIGEVLGKDAVVIDDMTTSGGTVDEAAKLLLTRGARQVSAYTAHAVFSGNAQERISASPLHRLVVTDTIHQNIQDIASEKIEVLSVAEIFANAIRRIHEEDSISALFEVRH